MDLRQNGLKAALIQKRVIQKRKPLKKGSKTERELKGEVKENASQKKTRSSL